MNRPVLAAISILALTTQIVLLGTGNEGPVSHRAGPATAIVVDGRAYLVDFGPGVIRRAAVAHDAGIAGLDPVALTHAFATQLHFNRTGGYPDLVFMTEALGRKQPLEIYGPPGIRSITDHVLAAWSDVAQGRRVNVHETRPGIVYRDPRVTVIAFDAGYRIQIADRRIVIGGDASPRESIAGQCNGCDVLIHSVNTQSVRRLSELATRARPELLILQREDATSEDELLRRIRAEYRGRFVIGHDLDVF
jgi:ribonuclease BN (tRNA processing enzyme)